MFYAHFVLSKKGPLARIWLAAHWDKKLTKAHVFETNIDSSVEAIIQPKVKLALRTSGHLLLGVVRIYSRKAKYLLADCNEAFVKIKMAFRPGVVDLPEENREAAVATITLPETFHDFETTMADLNDIEVQAQFTVNQSRPEEITMREDLGNITLVGDDGFGDMGFDNNMIQDVHMDDTLYVKNTDSVLMDSSVSKDTGEKPMDIDMGTAVTADDGFGAGIGDFDGPAGVEDDDSDDDNDFGGAIDAELFGENFVGEAGGLFEEPPIPEVQPPPEPEPIKEVVVEKEMTPEEVPGPVVGESMAVDQTTSSVIPDQTTLITNEAEAFALEPIDVTSLGTERKAKRKRKLVIDEQKGIPSEQMKMQLSDTSDIITTLDLAPPTKKLMHWKETGGVEKLFALPGRSLVSKRLVSRFNKNLVTRSMKEEDEYYQERAEEEEDEEDDEADQDIEPEPEPEPEPLEQDTIQPEPLARPEPIVDEQEQLREQESHVADPHLESTLEPFSVLEEPSRTEPPSEAPSMINDTSSMIRQPEEPTPAPPSPPQAPIRRYSSDDDANDAIFDDIPDEPSPESSEAEDGDAEGDDAEEKRWTKRTHQMVHILSRTLEFEKSASFKELVSRNNRKQVASKFYTFLVLKKLQAVELQQREPFGDILISKGPNFAKVY